MAIAACSISPGAKSAEQLRVDRRACTVESHEQTLETARISGRGRDHVPRGAYKPRTSPYAFQGLARKACASRPAKEETGLPIVTELMDVRDPSQCSKSPT